MAKHFVAPGEAGWRALRSGPVSSKGVRDVPLARRLRARRWYAPALTVVTLLGMLALIVTASLGARANAEAAAQQRLSQAARLASALLTTNGVSLSIDDNDQLVANANNSTIILARDSSLVNHLSALAGANVIVYQLKGSALIAVTASSAMATTRGETLADPMRATLLGHDTTSAKAGSQQQYTGEMSFHGVGYVASIAPLFDQAGAFIGAVAAAASLAGVMASSTQLTVMLALVGLLLTLLTLALGLWFAGAFGGQALATLNQRLASLGIAASNVEETVATHTLRAQRQERIGRLLNDDAYQLATLATALGEQRGALQEAVNSVWASVSQPGGVPDAQAILWLARQTAVTAAQLGASAEEAENLCLQMTPLLNRLIGEDRALSESAALTQRQASALSQAVEQVEMTIGANLAPHGRQGLSSLMERASLVAQRLRHQTHANTSPVSARAIHDHPTQPSTQSGRSNHARQARATPPLTGADGFNRHRPTRDRYGFRRADLPRIGGWPAGATSSGAPQERTPSSSKPSHASSTSWPSWPSASSPGGPLWQPRDSNTPDIADSSDRIDDDLGWLNA